MVYLITKRLLRQLRKIICKNFYFSIFISLNIRLIKTHCITTFTSQWKTPHPATVTYSLKRSKVSLPRSLPKEAVPVPFLNSSSHFNHPSRAVQSLNIFPYYIPNRRWKSTMITKCPNVPCPTLQYHQQWLVQALWGTWPKNLLTFLDSHCGPSCSTMSI